jgi:SanA protein
MKRTLIIFLRVLLITGCAGIFLIGAIRIAMILVSRPAISLHQDAEPVAVVIVPGAGLNRDGTPSLPLRDRVDSAVALYQAGKAQKILMSGDNSTVSYNEPEAMRQYALEQGVPDEDIVLDYAGRRTYDTCLRARLIFGLDKAAITTQAYHLHRAVFLCQALGIDILGIPVEESRYQPSRFLFWNFREVLASAAAFWDVYIKAPEVILGEPEPIQLP